MMNSLIKQMIQTFTQGSAIFKVRYYNPLDILFKHLPVTEKVKKPKIIRMRNCYFVDTIISIHIEKIAKIGGKVIEIHENVFYTETFEISLLKRVIEKLFHLTLK